MVENLFVGFEQKYDVQYSQEQVKLFVKATGDNNPIHLDPVFAQRTIFGRTIIHGMLGGSVFSRIFGTEFPGPGTIYLKQSFKFLQPMYANAKYVARVRIIDILQDKHRIVFATTIEDSKGNCTIVGEATVQNEKV